MFACSRSKPRLIWGLIWGPWEGGHGAANGTESRDSQAGRIGWPGASPSCGCDWNPKMGFPLHAAGPLSGDGAWRYGRITGDGARACSGRATDACSRQVRLHTRNVISKFALLAPDDLAAGSADGCAADCFARYHNAGHSRARRRVTADVFSALAFKRWRLHFLNQRRIVAWGA